MRNSAKGNSGFTLVELILTITILAMLSLAAFVKNYFNMIDSAQTATRDTVAAAVQSGLKIYASKKITEGINETYPAALDGASDGTDASDSNPFFSDVLELGVTEHWHKRSPTCYSFTGDGAFNDYFRYDPTTGAFEVTTDAGCT
ncbi:MAG: prepilin-type N-terminal cleavage/methylation domain-containing protein [Pseudomonadota bacterium]